MSKILTNLTGTVFSVVAQISSFTWEVEFSKNNKELKHGYSTRVLKDLQYLLNFGTKLFTINETKISLNDGGKISPGLHQLMEGEVDLSINHVVPLELYNSKLLSTIEILHPSYNGINMFAIFQQPRMGRIQNLYLLPFSHQLWMSCFTGLLIIYGLRTLVLKKQLSGADTMLSLISSISLQGFLSCKSEPFAGKLMHWLGSLTAVSFYWVYSASLYSIITSAQIPVKSFPDLITYKYTMVVHENSASGKNQLQNLIDVYKLRQKEATTNTDSEITILLDSPTALISYWDLFRNVATWQNYTDQFLCSTLTWISFPQMRRSHCWITRKGFPYKEVFNVKLLLLRERGLNFKYATDSFRGNVLFCKDTKNTDIFVSTNETFSAFIICVLGIILSVLVLLGELVRKGR